MLKKIIGIMLSLMLAFSLTACSGGDDSGSDDSGTAATTEDGVKIKTVDDFTEGEGLISYFMIEEKNFSIPETVGEYANYLEQLGTVTLNETGNSVEDEKLNEGGISSMAAYLKVETDDGDEARFYVRYENTTDKEIPVAEATVTFLEVKYDPLSENKYDKVFDSIEVFLNNGESIPMSKSYQMERVSRIIGASPAQNTDGRLHYTDGLNRKYIFDCCNEGRDGTFRGFSIEYQAEEVE